MDKTEPFHGPFIREKKQHQTSQEKQLVELK
jgi:hypothetical protein